MNTNDLLEIAAQTDGWMTDSQILELANIASRCDLFIEVGVFHGKTTKVLAAVCPGTVIAVDHFAGAPDLPNMSIDPEIHKKMFEDHLAAEIESGKVKLYAMDSAEAAITICLNERDADCVFIDGNHTYEGCKNDIIAYLPTVKSGGILCGHDYGLPAFPGITQAVNELLPGFTDSDTIWQWVKP